MRTKLIFMLVLVVLAGSINAQSKDEKPFTIGAGAAIGLPVGDVSTDFSLAWGLDLMGEYAVAPSLGVTLSAGYVDWVEKSGSIGSNGSVPVLAGVKYYFADKFYGSAQLGVSIFTQYGGGNYFTFAPGIGYKISERFDLLLKYQSITDSGFNIDFIGIRAGLSF